MSIGTLSDIAPRLRDGQRIGLGGFWFVRNPMALADIVLESGVRDLELVCFGGGLAVERLIAEKRVRKIYFSFHSLDVLGPAPAFRAALESGEVEGVELTTLVMAKALRAAEENLPFLPIRGPEGSGFIDGPYPLAAIEDPVTGVALRAVPALPLDVALLHGTRADERGNVEIVGAYGLDLRILGAARDRIVSVEEIVEPFRGPEASHRTTVARFLVDTVVAVPGGARPGSCLPYYATDIPSIEADGLAGRPATDDAPIPAAADDDTPTNAEMLIFTLARQLVDGGVYTVGSVTPISMVAYQLAKLTHAPNMAVIPFAGIVDVDFYPAAIAGSEESALANGYAFWGMEDLYELLYQSGRIDAEIFCPAQIDRHGDINNSLVLRDDGSPVRLPGQAGIADVAAMHRNLYMYLPRHSPQRLTDTLDFRGGSRYLVEDEDRIAAGFRPGEVTLVTDLCVLRQNKATRLLEIESIHPGVTPEQIIERTGFPIDVPADTPITRSPDRDTLDLMRRVVDPHGVRNIETVPSAQRHSLLHDILRHEATGNHEATERTP